MKFNLTKASDWNFESEVIINSIEELLDFIKKEGRLIIDSDSIKIYDDYIE
jgi:hypothetical protein